MTSPRASRKTDECICPEMPIDATVARGFAASTERIDATLACHHASGSCSAHPGSGVESSSGVIAAASTSPVVPTRMALTPLVPTSTPRKQGSGTSTHSEKDLHRELIEALVGVALQSHSVEVERALFDLSRARRAEYRAIRFAAARSK